MRNISGLGLGWIGRCNFCGVDFRKFSTKQTVCSERCRFFLYQNKKSNNECWEWSGPLSADGYGVLFLNKNRENGRRKSTTAHRYSYLVSIGEIPDSKCVMHSCDNRKCTNPAHLSIGTWDVNNKDRSAKGRSGVRKYSEDDKKKYSNMMKGDKNPFAKLTEKQAIAIKYNHPELSNKDVGLLYGVSKATAGQIRTGRMWKHLTE